MMADHAGEGFLIFRSGPGQFIDYASLALMKPGGDTGCFLPCSRLRWNGEDGLIYFTRSCRPLPEKGKGQTRADFARILLKLWEAFEEFDLTEAVDPGRLVLRKDLIFEDNRSGRVKLLYLAWRSDVYGRDKNRIRRMVREKQAQLGLELLREWFCPLPPLSLEGRIAGLLRQRPVPSGGLIYSRLQQLLDIEKRRVNTAN